MDNATKLKSIAGIPSSPWYALVQRAGWAKPIRKADVIDLLRNGEHIPLDVYNFLADVVADKVLFQEGSYSKTAALLADAVTFRHLVRAMVEVETERLSRAESSARSPEATAYRTVAEHFNVDVRTLKKHLKT